MKKITDKVALAIYNMLKPEEDLDKEKYYKEKYEQDNLEDVKRMEIDEK